MQRHARANALDSALPVVRRLEVPARLRQSAHVVERRLDAVAA
jgi:hypothetical protein